MTSWLAQLRLQLPAAVTLVVGALISYMLFTAERGQGQDAVAEAFQRAALDHAAAVRKAFDDAVDVMDSVGALYAASQVVELDEFQRFARTLLARHVGIQALGWAPRVEAKARQAYEAQMRETIPGFRITESDDAGKLAPAGQRPVYFPVSYLEPYTGNEAAAGFDLASDPARHAALQRARDTGKVIGTGRINLVQDSASRYGFLLLLPVFASGVQPLTAAGRSERLLGVAVAVIHVADLVESALRYLDSEGLEMLVYDESAPEGERFLYRHAEGDDHLRAGAEVPDTGWSASDLWMRTAFSLAGRDWSVVVRPAAGEYLVVTSWKAWGVLGAGLSFTALLVAYLALTRRRARELLSSNRALIESERALRRAEGTLKAQLQSEALVAAISGRFLNLPFDELEDGMTGALASLGEIAQVTRAYVFLLSEDGRALADAYEWSAPGVPGHDFESFRGLPVDRFPWSMRQFLAGQTVVVHDPQTLPAEAQPEREACTALGIGSYVNMPLFLGGKLLGWLGLDAAVGGRQWSEEELKLLGICGDVLISAIERKRRDEMVFREKERAQVTLDSIAQAVITTDGDARVEYLNPLAEGLTGWVLEQARGRPLGSVLYLVDEETREPAADVVACALREGHTGGFADPVVLISRGGQEYGVEVSVAVIRGRRGEPLGAVLVFTDVTEARRLARQMKHQAAHDPLTGLVNRREFDRRLYNALASHRQHGTPCAVCFLDLDAFKAVNDRAGHIAGDELLRQVATLLTSNIRSRDTLARVGGDEFALLLENCPLPNATEIAEGLLTAVREFRFQWQGQIFRIGVSIGLTSITDQTQDLVGLIHLADTACYAAKEHGGGQIYVYLPGQPLAGGQPVPMPARDASR